MMNTRFIPMLFMFLVISANGVTENSAKPVLFEDFETTATGGLCAGLLKRKNLSLAEGEGVGGTFALKAAYVGYERGSERLTMLYNLPERSGECSLLYDVKFAEDFQFVKGGKMHGLGPDSPITGGNEMKPEGWSARVVFTQQEGAATYLYCNNKTGKWGVCEHNKDFKFEKGKYYAVTLHVRLNEPDKDNGFAHLYVNGKLIVQHDNVRFREVGGDNTLISKFLFSAFHGGHKPDWAPRTEAGEFATVHAFFDNFAVYRGKRIRPAPGE